MVKVKTIVRIQEEESRETQNDIFKRHKNTDSTLHPFQQAREYVRALNAAKLEKIFAKPFIAALKDHTDSVLSLARSDKYLSLAVSGSANGEIKLWDLTKMTCKLSMNEAHAGFVNGLSMRGDYFASAGRDSVIKLWSFDGNSEIYNSSMPLNAVDISWEGDLFASCGHDGVQVWDFKRSEPLSEYQWGSDSTTKIKYNPTEFHLLGTTVTDRSIILIDTRANSCLQKFTLKMKSNDFAWNPREPMNFTVANEDTNLYTFDMRNLSEPIKIHKDHINAVTSVSYSPTGREFASGSFDKTVRIFDVRDGRSKEVYHTRRMQWIHAVEFTGDGKFVLTGSDDTNVRVWKAKADEQLKTLMPREQEAINYRERLKKKYQYVPEMRRILKHRHLPRYLFKTRKIKQIQKESEFRKERNRRAHTKPENIKNIKEKSTVVINEEE
ncbi:unnamed protein product [Blepharisma stoltei]|uniref:DDB1- and CUL4-associated factor 13 n=1 Tax=Blepharisma stoltei TaxID=1481888 RepID=A0AAU9K6M7_9CILI|nr:unnamed protein product [Blepharisma stoltei]